MQFTNPSLKNIFMRYFCDIPKRKISLCRCTVEYKPRLLRNCQQFPYYRIRNKTSVSGPIDTPKTVCLAQYAVGSTLFVENDELIVDPGLENYSVRNILHSHVEDALINTINNCDSVSDLFQTLNDNYEHFKGSHISQCVLVLWDLQKIYNESYLHKLDNQSVDYSPESMMAKYLSQLRQHPDFVQLLRLLEVHVSSLSTSEAVCCLLYLHKMGVPFSETSVEALLGCLEMKLSADILPDAEMQRGNKADPIVPAMTIADAARLTAALEPSQNYRFLPVVRDLMPTILYHVDHCESTEEFRLLTLLLQASHVLVSEELLARYCNLLRRLINKSILTPLHCSIILKAANFLNLPHWSSQNINIIRDLCEMVAPEIPNMDAGSIVTLHRFFQSHREPGHMMAALSRRTAQLVAEMLQDDTVSPCLKLPHLLFCQVTHSPPESRPALEKATADLISKMFPSTLIAFYKILRYIKTPNKQLSDQFWGHTLNFLLANEAESNLVLRFSHKYLYFSNVGGMYRNMHFEKCMLQMLLKMFSEGYMALFPRKFSRLSAFVIAFGYSSHSVHIDDFERIIQHIESTKDQFDSLDCLLLSRGLQVSSVLKTRRHVSPVLAQLLLRVDNVISEKTQLLSENKTIKIGEVNSLVKSHINKKTEHDSDIVYDIIKRYSDVVEREEFDQQLSSQVMRDAAFNLLTTGACVPILLERMARYVAHRKQAVLGETAQRILQLFYAVDYMPQEDGFFTAASDVLERDKSVINSLALLQACSALSYFSRLSETMVRYVFSLPFMERLDQEVASCYQKWVYPRRVRQQLMELNRSVCLERPELRVPWFHHKYLQEQLATSSVRVTSLEREVGSVLRALEGGEVRPQHIAPYGLRVPFLITPHQRPHDKVALLVLGANAQCRWLRAEGAGGVWETRAGGPARLLARQLELLGYRPVHLAVATWRSLPLADASAKARHLRNLLQLSHNYKT